MPLRIEFAKLGTNGFGATFGDLVLSDGNTEILRVKAFSGGNSFNPLDDGTYRVRLDIRGGVETNVANADGTLQPFYGIQQVGGSVPDPAGNPLNMQWEWGSIRARLNPTDGGTDHGDYIHGKQRPDDWTHGCICDRSEAILQRLWQSTEKNVDVVVSGGALISLEQVITKNIGTRRQS
ncbi:MAG: hypothetical protein ABIR54_00955 [Burkholderiaceae bacterium]